MVSDSGGNRPRRRRRAPLLLADEPMGAPDSVNGEGVMRLIRTECAGVAGVIVTYDAQLASWADRSWFLRDGRIVDRDGARSRSRIPSGHLGTVIAR